MEGGLPAKVASTLTEEQISQLHSRLFNEQPQPQVVNKTVKQILLPPGSETKVRGVSVSNTGGKTTITSDEMSEEKENKKNLYAICTAKLGPRKTAKFHSCVKQVEKSLKESENRLSSAIENRIMELLETHLPPKITKKDLLQYLQESPEVAPSKPKTKPGTRPTIGKPNPGINPRPNIKPSPQAKSKEVSESPEVAPSKPKTEPKPGTKEPPKPSKKPNPFKNPRPEIKPAPQAKTKSKEVKEDSTATAPSKPKTKPGTKEPTKPSKKPNPFKNPRPEIKPAPQAIAPEEAKEKIIDTIMQILQNEKN